MQPQIATEPQPHPSSLAERFAWATEQRLRLIGHQTPETLQHLYGLYKQATLGDNPLPRPPEHHRIDHAKWTAWDTCRGMTPSAAMAEYLRLVQEAEARLAAQARKKRRPSSVSEPRRAERPVPSGYDVPDHPHDQLGDWKNHACEIFVEEFGEERYREACAEMLHRPPPSHRERELLDQHVMRLYQHFFNQADFALPVDSYVLGAGTLEIDPDLPPILGPDLAPGRRLPLVLRHKNVTRGNSEFERFQDDRSVTLFRGSLKIDLGGSRVFDLPMVTSRIFYPNLPSFMKFTLARDPIYTMYATGHPVWYAVAIEGQRMGAKSFTSVVYHAPIPRFFRDPQGRERLAKFRMTPVGLEREEGLLDTETQLRMLREVGIKDETATEKWFLVRDYRERLRAGPVAYELEILVSPPLDEVADPERLKNPAFVWDESVCPAHRLGTVRIDRALDGAGPKLEFNPVNLPDAFFFPEPDGLYDPVATNWIRRKMYPCAQASHRVCVPRAQGEGPHAPHLLILRFEEAPTDADLSLRIVGERGTTGRVRLADLLDDAVIDGQEQFAKVDLQPVGAPLAIEIESDRDLPVRWIGVVHSAGTAVFRSESPISAGRQVWFDARGWTPEARPEPVRERVASLLAERRAGHPWSEPDGLPRFTHHASLEAVPAWDQYPIRNAVFTNTKVLEQFRKPSDAPARFCRWSELEQLVEERYPDCRVPEEVLTDWKSDRMFVEQFLSGFHADHIRRCDAVPDGLPEVERARLRVDLDAEIAAGRVFVADYRLLAGISDALPSPVVLFHLRSGRGLRPLGIQLEAHGPVFTPDDPQSDWLAAKMWARLADTNLGGMAAHLLFSHQVMASFHTAIQRNLPTSHPLYGLLVPHLKNVLAAALVGHEVLLAPGAIFDKITAMRHGALEVGRRAWAEWSLKRKLDLPADLAHRGVGDLPHYPWRDDGLCVWEALQKLARSVVEAVYADDASVLADREVQAFAHEAATVGLEGSDLARSIETRDALVALVTGILWGSSAGHAAINSPMFTQLAFVPHSPWRLEGDWPRERGVHPDSLLAAIPDRLTVERTIDMMAILGNREVPGFFAGDEADLGEEELGLYRPAVQLAWATFRDDLAAIEETIRERNRSRWLPYEGFLPGSITASASW